MAFPNTQQPFQVFSMQGTPWQKRPKECPPYWFSLHTTSLEAQSSGHLTLLWLGRKDILTLTCTRDGEAGQEIRVCEYNNLLIFLKKVFLHYSSHVGLWPLHSLWSHDFIPLALFFSYCVGLHSGQRDKWGHSAVTGSKPISCTCSKEFLRHLTPENHDDKCHTFNKSQQNDMTTSSR